MEGFGIPPEAFGAAIEEEREARDFEVYADNFDIAQAFAALGTQWRVIAGAMGGVAWLGIEYASIPSLPIMRTATAEQYEDTFAGLRLMESAARKVLNERAEE